MPSTHQRVNGDGLQVMRFFKAHSSCAPVHGANTAVICAVCADCSQVMRFFKALNTVIQMWVRKNINPSQLELVKESTSL